MATEATISVFEAGNDPSRRSWFGLGRQFFSSYQLNSHFACSPLRIIHTL